MTCDQAASVASALKDANTRRVTIETADAVIRGA